MDRVKQAMSQILAHEGEWAFDPDDPGGRTWRGTTQRDWGWLKMWGLLEKCMENGAPNVALLLPEELAQVDADVRLAFVHGYWARTKAPQLLNYSIAVQLVDTAYHTGAHRAVSFLQRGLNVLNRAGTLYQDISVDGGVGKVQTLPALKRCLDLGRGPHLHFLFKSYRAAFYTELMESSEKREKYLGWFTRAASWTYSPEPL